MTHPIDEMIAMLEQPEAGTALIRREENVMITLYQSALLFLATFLSALYVWISWGQPLQVLFYMLLTLVFGCACVSFSAGE